jgi:hypothetical protein
MRGQILFEGAGASTGKGISVTNLNIFFFSCRPTKFWTNFSEITAPLPPNILNLLFLKYKFRGQRWGQLGGRWGQQGGRKAGVKTNCTQDFSHLFRGLVIRGQRGSSKDRRSTRFSAGFAQSLHFAGYRKSRFLLLFQQTVLMVYRYRQIKDLGFPCAGFRLATCSRRVENRRKGRNHMTALSQIMCGYGLRWSKEINKLEWSGLRKCAVSFGFDGGGCAWQTPPPLKIWRRGRSAPPPLHSINWSYFPRAFYRCFRLLRRLVCSKDVFGLVFAARKEGGAGGTC